MTFWRLYFIANQWSAVFRNTEKVVGVDFEIDFTLFIDQNKLNSFFAIFTHQTHYKEHENIAYEI